MKFETFVYADVSTLYLEPSDLPLVLKYDCPTRFGVVDGNQGTLHWVSDDWDSLEEYLQNAIEFGLSERFCEIMRELHKQGISYVRFDADGADVQGLESRDHA